MRLRTIFLALTLIAAVAVFARLRYVAHQPPGTCVKWYGTDKACVAAQALSADTLEKIGGSETSDPLMQAGMAAISQHHHVQQNAPTPR